MVTTLCLMFPCSHTKSFPITYSKIDIGSILIIEWQINIKAVKISILLTGVSLPKKSRICVKTSISKVLSSVSESTISLNGGNYYNDNLLPFFSQGKCSDTSWPNHCPASSSRCFLTPFCPAKAFNGSSARQLNTKDARRVA